MKNLQRSYTDKVQIEDLARRFSSKSPNETTFNNNKTKKYFDPKSSFRKESISSKDTVKMSYHSGRKSNLSIINSEFGQCLNTLSKCASLKTENDKEITNMHNFYIVCCERLSSKKEAVKLNQKHIGEDQDMIYFDEVIDELEGVNNETVFHLTAKKEEYLDQEKIEFSKKVSSNTTTENLSTISSTNDEIVKMIEQRSEILTQIDNLYSNVKKQIDEKNSVELNKLIDYWFQIIPGTLDLILMDRVKSRVM
jgi:hypothetical protein